MPSRKTKIGAGIGAFFGFVAMSAVAGVLITAGVAPGIAVTGLAASGGVSAFEGLPDYLQVQPLDQKTTFYATKGGQEVPIATFYAQNRVDVGWNDVSQFAKDAAVATEDPRFYDEGGIDLIGSIRAGLSDAAGSSVQGGSSITQQYVKNVLVQACNTKQPNPDASAAVQKTQGAAFEKCYKDASGVDLQRKLKEMRYAIGIDKTQSKDQILLSYLNITGFGGQVYGVEAASEYYFGVAAKDLNLQQAATLVAILNNPSNLRIDQDATDNPKNNAANGFPATLERRNYVLERMYANQKITKAQEKAALATKIEPKITPVQSGCQSAAQAGLDAGFFCNYVQDVMLQDPAFGKTDADRQNFFNLGGLNVYTTLNLDLQANAQAAVSNYIPPTSPNLDLGSSNVAMEVGTGRIVEMVENKPYDDSGTPAADATSINYNTDYDYGGSGGFQTGSSFKAFDLTAWLQQGYGIYNSVTAPKSGTTFPIIAFHSSCPEVQPAQWTVENDEGEAGGSMTVLSATEASVNTAFAEMGTKTDLCAIYKAATSLDVHPANPNNGWQLYPSMILGINYISPLTMATAYAGIANNGMVCTPIAIDKITEANGKDHAVPKTTCTQGIDPKIAAGVNFALQHVITAGTATAANPNDGTEIMAKTGTTDNSEQNWLVTSTTKVASATWVGNIQGSVALRSQYFDAQNGGPTEGGGDVKFYIARPILKMLDQVYPAGPLASPGAAVLNGVNGPPEPAPTQTATPNPSTQGQQQAPAQTPQQQAPQQDPTTQGDQQQQNQQQQQNNGASQ